MARQLRSLGWLLLASLLAVTLVAGCVGAQQPSKPKVAYAADSAMQKIVDRGKLRAAVRDEIQYLSIRNPQTNELEGFEVDALKEFATFVFGEPGHLELKAVDNKARIPVLQAREVDIVTANMTMTPERAQQIHFSYPYLRLGYQVMVRADSGINGVKDLKGKKAATVRGAEFLWDGLKDHFMPGGDITYFENHPVTSLALLQGKVDAHITDDFITADLMARNPGKLKWFDVTQAMKLPWGSDWNYIAAGLHTDDNDLRRYFNLWLQKAYEDGTLQQLWKKNMPAGLPYEGKAFGTFPYQQTFY